MARVEHDLVKTLGDLIRRERRALNLTQQELADHAGTGLNFVSQLERGKETARLDKTLAVLRILGIELRACRGRKGISVADELEP